MTLAKAIETLKDHLAFDDPPVEEDRRAAVLLGIEALKCEQERRKLHSWSPHSLFPGETKE